MKFKKDTKEQLLKTKIISGLKEAVRELNELYEEAREEYEALEDVSDEFKLVTEALYRKLDDQDQLKMQDVMMHWNKVKILAKNNIRDIRDVLRNHKKRLKELQNEI